jgi:hypothetical protein
MYVYIEVDYWRFQARMVQFFQSIDYYFVLGHIEFFSLTFEGGRSQIWALV